MRRRIPLGLQLKIKEMEKVMEALGALILTAIVVWVALPSQTEVREAMKRKERSKREDL